MHPGGMITLEDTKELSGYLIPPEGVIFYTSDHPNWRDQITVDWVDWRTGLSVRDTVGLLKIFVRERVRRYGSLFDADGRLHSE